MPEQDKPKAVIEEQIVLIFKLPGVHWQSYSGVTDDKQLEPRLLEEWRLRIARENVSSTLRCLRDVVAELERFEGILKVRPDA